MGEIQLNECHYCLDCQVTYWNEHKCPPLVNKRKRRERAKSNKEKVQSVSVNPVLAKEMIKSVK